MIDTKRFKWDVRPIADARNIVKGECYRFTVLTPSLIRIEYDKNGIFEDRASQSVFYRDFESVEFNLTDKDNKIVIETEKLILSYIKNQEFSYDTLSIKLKDEPATLWHYSEDFEDLGGTVSTLDRINGAVPLGRGVCSRNGFSVIDDSKRMVLDNNGWVDIRNKDTKDIYFFGYGFDYLKAVKDLIRLTGIPELLPAYALGNWWSRYHNYTQDEYVELMEKFIDENIPFSVAIIDMDWHIVDTPDGITSFDECGPGWTGYSWNKELFPDYKSFLDYLNKKNLKTALNLHPADGCRWHEDMYEKMCLASGMNPEEKKKVPFDILNPKAMQNYFDIILHPYENDGVDFWWVDWQQGKSYGWIHSPNENGKFHDEKEVLDPLWMLNHLHILDIKRNGKRPMYFSRYSGPGSQRYAIGFSGDTHVTWESLDFQPYFTACASNIGYGWWSHDIGGHMLGYRDDELITRWIQLGTFSPINRLHSSCDPFHNKEPWEYPTEYASVIKDYLRLRAEFFPYIYTMNYRLHKEALPLIWPMYYTYPKNNAAYEAKNQFWFGSELFVSPVTSPADKHTKLGRVNVWFPQGVWFDFFDGTVYYSDKGRKLDIFRKLNDYPVFAKAGAIVPQTVLKSGSNKTDLSDELLVTVFPGQNNTFTLYEDEGDYDNYKKGKYIQTTMQLNYSDNKALFTLLKPEGDLSLLPKKRKWNINFRGFSKDISVILKINNKEEDFKAKYNELTHTYSVLFEADVDSEIVVTLESDNLIYNNSDNITKCFNIIKEAQIDFVLKKQIYDIVNDKNKDIHTKMKNLYKIIPSMKFLSGALKEQLSLEHDEFYNIDL